MSAESVRLLWSVLAEASLRAAGAAALAALVLAVTRTRAPGVRHAVWATITVAMLAMPLLPHALPPVRVAALPSADLWPAASERLPVVLAYRTDRTAPARAEQSALVLPAVAVAETASKVSPVNWLGVAAIVYLGGLLASVVYLAAGWLAMTAIVRRSRPVALPDGSLVHESAIVAAPLTAGVFTPQIILPINWRSWPADTLRAVVMHERTHIRRRDPLFALAARVNRCVFWFHPLAWWLERKLAAVAEFACDESASRACGAPADYAQVLVEMADDVRKSGGRLAWQGIAVSGNGQLKDRIERLLAGTSWPAVSRRKKMLVACSCVLAVAIAAACRPGAHAKPLQADPALAARQAEQRARTARFIEAVRMTPEQVSALEAAVARAPDDRESREKLLAYYGDVRRKLDPDAIAARRAHVLWMVEHHPDVDTPSSWALRLYTVSEEAWLPESMRLRMHANADPEGYAQASRLWLAAMTKPEVSVQTLTNAARFFEMADKPLAEAALLEAAKREPGKWSAELGRLYGLIILGSGASWSPHVVQHVSMTAAHGAYANGIRRKLEESTDATLLAWAGQVLQNAEHLNTRDKAAAAIDFDVRALGQKYLERAAELDPGAGAAAAILAGQRLNERSWPVFRSLSGWRPTPEEVAALPETERLDVLWKLIADSFYQGESLYYNKNDRANARVAWQRLSIYANDALTIGPRHLDHPGTGPAMFNAHVFLGTVALWDGGVRSALAHLEALPDVPPSDALMYSGGVASNRLVKNLLAAGEHDAVADYCERMAKIHAVERASLTETTQAIRAGKMPEWYQTLIEGEAERSPRQRGR